MCASTSVFSTSGNRRCTPVILIALAHELDLRNIKIYRLRVMALLSSDCRGTVESLSSVHSSSTIAELPFSLLDANCMHVLCRQSSKHFHFSSINSYFVILLFHYSVLRVLQCSLSARDLVTSRNLL